jgi:sterol desaturase/sphingolipid hydroxylase (fatty acid hydroxylase superfamily)
MTSFYTYLFGFIVLIIGLSLAAYLLGVPPVWIAVGVIILIGIAVMSASNFGDRSGPPPP